MRVKEDGNFPNREGDACKSPRGVDRLRGVRGEVQGEGYVGQQARPAGLLMLDRLGRMVGFYLVGYGKPDDFRRGWRPKAVVRLHWEGEKPVPWAVGGGGGGCCRKVL